MQTLIFPPLASLPVQSILLFSVFATQLPLSENKKQRLALETERKIDTSNSDYVHSSDDGELGRHRWSFACGMRAFHANSKELETDSLTRGVEELD